MGGLPIRCRCMCRTFYIWIVVLMQIPILTEATMDSIPSNTLVRFRGMVQDMLNPEYYVGEYKDQYGVWHTTKYSDVLDDSIYESEETKFAERQPMLVIPLPGMSGWLSGLQHEEAVRSVQRFHVEGSNQTLSRKRGMENNEVMEDMCEQDGAKHLRQEGVLQVAGMAAPIGTGVVTAGEASVPSEVQERIAPEIPKGSCVMQVYDNDEVKLNDIVEVVGVLSRVPEIASCKMGSMMEEDRDALASKIPTSVAPRVHAVLLRKLSSSLQPARTAGLEKETIQQARARTKGFLSMVLGGDDLAAEYLLLQLLSRVHSRNQSSEHGVLGMMPLNLTGVPHCEDATVANVSPLGDALATAIRGLMPMLQCLPLSISALNAKPWCPGRLQDQVFLSQSPLQLPPGCVLMLDETVMSTGNLNETALRNLGAIQKLMLTQKIPYNFQLYELDQSTDNPVIILSTGKTMLKGSGEVQIPVAPVTKPAEKDAVDRALDECDAAASRVYLATMRNADFSIPTSIEKQLEEEMTKARKQDTSGVTAETFHSWLHVRSNDAVQDSSRFLL